MRADSRSRRAPVGRRLRRAKRSPCGAGGAPGGRGALSARRRACSASPMPPNACGELGRHDEHLVRVAFGERGQHLQVFVAEQLAVGFALVDRFEHGVDRLRFALGAQDRRLALALGVEHGSLLGTFGGQDGRLLGALGGEDLRLLLTFGGQDRRAAVALGAHLLLHRGPDVRRRVDRLDLDAVDADAPLARRLVEHDAQLGVDVLARGQRRLQRQAADHVSQRRDGQLLDRLQRIGDFIGGRARVGDREVEDRLDRPPPRCLR